MPTVRFQVTALSCSKTEDRGLLDSRSEDEVYIHGALAAGRSFKPVLVGDPHPRNDFRFHHVQIQDGETVTYGPLEDGSWAIEIADDGKLIVALTIHEEDANRSWPTLPELRDQLTGAISKVIELAAMNNRPAEPKDLAAATNAVMRSQEKFDVDDLLGEVLETVDVGALWPDSFERTVKLAGGSRVLASDFAYTLSYRVSRDDRDYGATLAAEEPVSVAILPGQKETLTITFKNTGHASFTADDLVLTAPREFSGWVDSSAPNLTITDDAAGILLSSPVVAPGEDLVFSIGLTAPPALGRAAYPLRLFVPSLKHFVDTPPVDLQLSSGRDIICDIETIANNNGMDADIKLVARDAVTRQELNGSIRVTGEEELFQTSTAFKVHSNMRHLMANPVQKGQDQIVWPFGSVQVDGYWPQLVTLKPA